MALIKCAKCGEEVKPIARGLSSICPKCNRNVFSNAYLVTLYTFLLLAFLFPLVGELKLPVTIYAIAIAGMLLTAIHAAGNRNSRAGWFCIAGAALFLCSDSLLALNKFYRPLAAANLLIMLTYGLAQFGIAKGSLLYLAGEKSVAA